MRILVCLDGSPTSEQAAHFADPALGLPDSRVMLFGVVERARDAGAIARAQEATAAWLEARGIPVEVKTGTRKPAESILAEARSGAYDLVVLGDPDRKGLARFLGGSVAERLIHAAPCAVLLGRAGSQQMRRILVCTAGGAPGLRDVAFTAPIAAAAGAELTVLHVMSQIALVETADPRDLAASAEELIARDTPEGRHLAQARARLLEAGVEPRLKVRHGLVLDEIAAEVREAEHDLVVVGATLARGLRRLLLDDVTAEVRSALDTAVLVVPGPAAGLSSAPSSGRDP